VGVDKRLEISFISQTSLEYYSMSNLSLHIN